MSQLRPSFKLLGITICLTLAVWGFLGFQNRQSPAPLPHKKIEGVIDFSQMDIGCVNDDPLFFEMGALGFNHAPELLCAIASLKQTHRLTAAVETGTFQGNTTRALNLLFDNVHSIEIIEKNYKHSKEHLQGNEQIHLHLGDSTQTLPLILKELQNESVLLYLDAHWGRNWPILDEIKAAAQTHKDRCVIVIDDVLVPGYEEIGFDEFDNQPLSYEFIQETVAQAFTHPQVFYLVPYKYGNRGKMVLAPAKAKA